MRKKGNLVMKGIRITEEPDWSVDTDMLSVDTPPEALWFCAGQEDSGQTLCPVYLGDRPCILLYEDPDSVQIPEGAQGPFVFYRFRTEAMCARFHQIGGQWLAEMAYSPEAPEAWLNLVIANGKDDGVCLLMPEKEWFENVAPVFEEWGVPLENPEDALENWKSVEYAWKRGGPPDRRAIFLVSRISEDDYIFSDGKKFYFANIMNPWEWNSRYDHAVWHTYERPEDLFIRHCCGNGSLVRLDLLPAAFHSYISNYAPTMDFVRFMRARETGYSATVCLIAHYGEKNGTPHDVRSLELFVGSGETDPAARKRTLISGQQRRIIDWLEKQKHQEKLIRMARRMLKQYEAHSRFSKQPVSPGGEIP